MGNKDVIIVILPLSFFFLGRSRKGDSPEDSGIKEEAGWLVYFTVARVSMLADKKYISQQKIHLKYRVKMMLLNCGVGEDFWESLGLQGDPTSPPEADQSWVFTGRTDFEAETPILWPPDTKS